MSKRDRTNRIIDLLNFLWSSLHDFLYIGIAAAAYWIWRQPEATRNTYLLAIGIAALFVVDAVINYRQHAKMERRLEHLEKRLREHEREGRE